MKKQILVIEDSEVFQMVIKTILKDTYDLKFAPSMKRGMDYILENKVDLILLDLNLPDGHGASLFAKMQNLFNFLTPPPIIAMTADTSNATCERAFIAGSKLLLKKPFSRLELTDSISRILADENEKRIERPINVGAFSFYPNSFTIRSLKTERAIKLERSQLAYMIVYDLALANANQISWAEFYNKYGRLSSGYNFSLYSESIKKVNNDLKDLNYKILIREEHIELKRTA